MATDMKKMMAEIAWLKRILWHHLQVMEKEGKTEGYLYKRTKEAVKGGRDEGLTEKD